MVFFYFSKEFILKLLNLGFWRESNNSAKLYECIPYKQSCLGNKTDLNEICAVNYRGPLCQTCQKNYAKMSGFFCNKCFSKEINFLIISLIIMSITVILSIYIKFFF